MRLDFLRTDPRASHRTGLPRLHAAFLRLRRTSPRRGLALRRAALCLVVLAVSSCGFTRVPLPSGPPRATPGLSVAGIAHFQCLDASERHLLPLVLDDRTPLLDVEGLETRVGGDIGSVIAADVACTRYTVEVAMPLPSTGPGLKLLPARLHRTADVIDSLTLEPGATGMLRSIAIYLRVNASERYVYGREYEVNDGESVSFRVEPGEAGGRVILLYRFEL